MTDSTGENREEVAPVKAVRKPRREWEQTHEMLAEAYLKFMANKCPEFPNPTGRQPTIAQLSKLTGVSTRTVERHLEELDKDIHLTRRVKKFRLMTDAVLKGMAQSAAKGNVPAIRTFLEVVENIPLSGGVVKVTPPADGAASLDLTALSDEDLAEYKRLIGKMKVKGAPDGGAQSGG